MKKQLCFLFARLFRSFLACLPSFGLMTLGFGGFHSSASEAFDSASRFFGVDDGFSPRISRFCWSTFLFSSFAIDSPSLDSSVYSFLVTSCFIFGLTQILKYVWFAWKKISGWGMIESVKNVGPVSDSINREDGSVECHSLPAPAPLMRRSVASPL